MEIKFAIFEETTLIGKAIHLAHCCMSVWQNQITLIDFNALADDFGHGNCHTRIIQATSQKLSAEGETKLSLPPQSSNMAMQHNCMLITSQFIRCKALAKYNFKQNTWRREISNWVTLFHGTHYSVRSPSAPLRKIIIIRQSATSKRGLSPELATTSAYGLMMSLWCHISKYNNQVALPTMK